MTNYKAALHNLGCKVNSYELAAVEKLLKEHDYEIVSFEPGADLYIINTCSVTNIADRKSRQMLHKAKQMNPAAVVIAMGCYAQTEAEALLEDKSVDIVIGNNKKNDVIKIIREFLKTNKKISHTEDLSQKREYEYLNISDTDKKNRGFVKVQDGCDRFCSYCIIPFTRGRSRSRSIGDTISEVKSLAKSGCREIVLSGIHLSSYGFDRKEDNALLNLIDSVHDIDGIDRIRLGSLEPGIITEELAAAAAGYDKLCPHFHLSMQSGCDRILKAMNRKYDTAEFKSKCMILRKCFDRPAITTDIIAGFPGETEEDFLQSLRFTEEMSFFETHVFPYSRRKGTKAAKLPDQLTEAEKKRRAAEYISLNKRKHAEWLGDSIGKETEILIEEKRMIGKEEYWIGHSLRYEKTAVKSDKELKNTIIRVTPKAHDGDCLLAIY